MSLSNACVGLGESAESDVSSRSISRNATESLILSSRDNIVLDIEIHPRSPEVQTNLSVWCGQNSGFHQRLIG